MASATFWYSLSRAENGVLWFALRKTRQIMRTDDRKVSKPWQTPEPIMRDRSASERSEDVPEQSTLETNESKMNPSRMNVVVKGPSVR